MKRLLGNRPRCQYQGFDGKRCKKKADIRETYYGDENMHNNSCVEIDVCENHALEIFNVKDLEIGKHGHIQNLSVIIYPKPSPT